MIFCMIFCKAVILYLRADKTRQDILDIQYAVCKFGDEKVKFYQGLYYIKHIYIYIKFLCKTKTFFYIMKVSKQGSEKFEHPQKIMNQKKRLKNLFFFKYNVKI